MPQINLVEKRARLSKWDVVKFQLITHCYLTKVVLSESEIDCIILLAIKGEQEIQQFCESAHNEKVFKSIQTVRNCLSKMEKIDFIKKEGKNKKRIWVNPDLKIMAEGNVLLDIRFAHIES
jgi:hypothetical protein